MADLKKRLVENIEGLFFVDNTCIDCDTCRQLAPETFGESGDYALVHHQPDTEFEIRIAVRALLACPTGSIGTIEKVDTNSVMDDFPLLIENNIFYNGFTSKNSFGASSYYIKHPEGNWMIDSPKYMPHLVKKFEEMGGISYIFLTHQDDVADAGRYAKYFGAKRIIHKYELQAQPDSEIVIEDENPLSFGSDFLIIPTPGHTRGHCVLLYKKHFLFTGDHLWWSRNRKSLIASRSVCWYSWEDQTKSMEKLLQYEIDWVIPGHGERMYLQADVMKSHLLKLTKSMHSTR